MIKSMTGYGIAHYEDDVYEIAVEVKTLNSKFLDLTLRSPRQFSDKEIEIRNLVSEKLERGKVHLSIEFSRKSSAELPVQIDEALFKSYFEKYSEMAGAVQATSSEIFKLALQSPNVTNSVSEKQGDDEAWEKLKPVLVKALKACDDFRTDEGRKLYTKFEENLSVIRNSLERVKEEEPVRKTRIKERIRNNFSDFLKENDFDENRFEQELIYYFEKLDITEEIVRLSTHLDYMEKSLKAASNEGKKMGFIGQELGREINTIGSKANDAGIQRHVILMKDELEQIKEQSLNIL
ncbi:YicC/YloC family endoribonuclease [Pararhodonellum marinum]|uniref:YicC/YloC family endoribonuclease n=1 Tax=Pararhodonellum marinum TaxID=2755358 RepID=UPI00188EFC6C|nr:YicC/YloC family endoribonuclease [Pararhodonellum marinum]